VEAERDALLADHTQGALPPGARVTALKGIGPEFGAVLGGEVFYRTFDNRRQIGSYAGLSPTPWRSGGIDKEQGISKAGNRRLRTTLIQIAWLWLRHQPTSELTLWFNERVKQEASRGRRVKNRRPGPQLLIALWKFEVHGEIPQRRRPEGRLTPTPHREREPPQHHRRRPPTAPDPGRRPCAPLATRRRDRDWYRLPEPCPTKAGFGCQPPRAATGCEVRAAKAPPSQSASDLGSTTL